MTEDQMIRKLVRAGYRPDTIAEELGIPVEKIRAFIEKEKLVAKK